MTTRAPFLLVLLLSACTTAPGGERLAVRALVPSCLVLCFVTVSGTLDHQEGKPPANNP